MVFLLCWNFNLTNSRAFFNKKKPARKIRDDSCQGTFLHPDLAILFARWINPDFAVWCDAIIKQILTGKIEIRYKELRQGFDKLEDQRDKLFEELRLYQRPEDVGGKDGNDSTPKI